jgi:hypothetical protein
MRIKWLPWVIVLIFGVFAGISPASAQFYQFKIKDKGVYKISRKKATELGFDHLSEISIFGYPGMLPQRLDSAQLQLQEIPALEFDDHLYFLLSGPNTLSYSSEGLNYSHHLFADSLSFLLGKSKTPRRITGRPADPAAANPEHIWYSFTTFKAEQINLLNSGRNWYSEPIRPGQSLNINVSVPAAANAPWILQGKLMAHSSSPSSMRVLSGNELLGKVAFDPIPNSTYGVKGREVTFAWEIRPDDPVSQIRFTYPGSGPAASGYLDYFVLGVPVANSGLRQGFFEAKLNQHIPLLPTMKTWEISDFFNPVEINSSSGNSASGKKWVIFSPGEAQEIKEFNAATMRLRTLATSPELLIITSPQLLSSATKLRDFKLSRGMNTMVVTTDEIYESFGYGNRDLTAIRNFIASTYHSKKKLKNVLILGKGTFDQKGKLGGRPNHVPIYSSRESLNPLTTFSSDDYLGLIDWGQGDWEESREGDEILQIGVGRVPAINLAEANELVEKIIRYESNPVRSPKSSTVTFLADDGDNNIHIKDAESHSEYLSANQPNFVQNKLFLDRFDQVKSGDSQRSPQAKAALQKTLNDGTLLLNFIGHGNETTLTAEEVFRVEDLADWPRQEQLALWITATCEFGRHDSPFIRSAAEELLFAKAKGAIGLLTTGRPVFSNVNFSLNKAFVEEVFKKKEGQYQDLGEIFKNTKNRSINGVLNRNFSLLGDPSLRLALPELDVNITAIDDARSGLAADTLKSFQEIVVSAEVIDPLTMAVQPAFNGEFQIELRGSPSTIQSLGDESDPFSFQEEALLIFKGLGKVQAGRMEARFIIPKGLKPEIGAGSLRINAWDSEFRLQAFGSRSPLIGGAKVDDSKDLQGPAIKLIINGATDAPFVFQTPTLQIKGQLSDESGINVSGLVIGQDLSIQINDQLPMILNEEFMGLNSGYQHGFFDVFLTGFVEGKNVITVRAWDNLGNESTYTQEVEIKDIHQLKILSHKVYPNPATRESTFELSHNRPGEHLRVNLEVISPTGQILFSENLRWLSSDQNISDMTWSFLRSQTQYPAKGSYIYKLSLQSESDFASDSVSGKLIIQ